jgi:pimeloyl-ACP methyl ester carboxylesterase
VPFATAPPASIRLTARREEQGTELTCGGATIVYDDLGEGEPAFLCMPGWCEPRTAFSRLAPLLAESRRTIVLDWAGQGDSGAPQGGPSAKVWLANALAVVEEAKVASVIPVAISHAGRVAIELARVLGPRVPKLVNTDWNFILDPPASYRAALVAFQDPDHWAASREGLFTTWIAGSTDEALIDHVRGEMAGFSFAEWARAMREIGAAYDTYGNPLQHLASLDPPVPAIHLYTQPRHRDYREGQEAFARENPWFRPQLLNAVSHFPTVDEPQEVAAAIFDFV